MPLDPSIPLQARAPESNPLATLLQVGQYKYLQQNSNRLQMDTDANQAVSQAIQKNTGQDGKVNLLGVQSDLSGDPRAGFNGQAIAGTNLAQQGQQLGNAGQQIGNDVSAQGLAAKRGEAVAKAGVALLTNPKATGVDYISSLSDLHKTGIIDDKTYIDSIEHVRPNLNDPARLQQDLRGMLAKLPDGIQAQYVKPVLGETSTGGSTQFTAKDPITGQVSLTGQVRNTIAPGQQETIRPDALGNPYIEQRDTNGSIVGTKAVPNSYSGVSGSPKTGPVIMPPGGASAVDDAAKEVTAARAAANQAPVMHDLNRSIIAEVDKGLSTGSLAQLRQKMASATGYNMGGDGATDYNVLGKMLERSAISAAQGMGPHTNAGLDAQVRANGSLDYTPQAIRKIAVLNDALASGVEHYRSGLENALQKSGQNPMVKREFDQAWAQNFDPRVMRLQNASQSGDKKEINAVLQEVGGANSKGAKDLATKARNLNALISQGHL